MAREIKKPTSISEADLKDFDGEVVIDISPKEEAASPEAIAPEVAPTEVEPAAAAEVISVAAVKATTPLATPTLTFNAWFQKAIARNPKIKLSYKEAVEAHCKAIGLKSQATEEAFNAALSHFGL